MPEIVWPEGWTYSIVHWGEFHVKRRTTEDDPDWKSLRINGDPHIQAGPPDVPNDIYCLDKAALLCDLLNERDHDKIDPDWLRQRAGDFQWRA